ncbi:MAG: CpaF family protein [Endomicrobium sp.]|jgi:pilus assembly protein CpaF|uniref:CpaF family protein n=1 Tax=Candidatus Endomicrobiellum cubanum TaxID=3242325 RepID=UPI00283939DF|nr:CpaF family protein [Endomicrobium sp.]
MFLISPEGSSLLQCTLIAFGLDSINLNKKADSIIVDFSVPDSSVFWSVYKSSIKYIEDVLPALTTGNFNIIKDYLFTCRSSSILCIKDPVENIDSIESVIYLLFVLDEYFKNVYVILPYQKSENVLRLIKEAKHCLIPFFSDSLSTKNTILFLQEYRVINSKLNFTLFRFNLDYNFYCDKMLLDFGVGAIIDTDFSSSLQKQILSPTFSYRDKTNPYVAALEKIVNLNSLQTKSTDNSNYSYYQNENVYKELKNNLQKTLIEEIKEFAQEKDEKKLKNITKGLVFKIIKTNNLNIPEEILNRLSKELCDEIAGLGVLEDLLEDSSITEIMVNGHQNIFVEKSGKIFKTDLSFSSEANLKTVIDRIIHQVGRHVDEASPIVDARLKDGSRVNAVISPISLDGSIVTIRKFSKDKLSIDSLLFAKSINQDMVEFLKLAVLLKKNIIVSGGTGTGKTTLLNIISSFIPENERLITIEDSAELNLQQKHVVRLESKPKSQEGTGEIKIRRLVINALRMRPDRIIVGECRSGEALDMLQAMSTGHEGSLTTLHATSPKDAISRLVAMIYMSGIEIPERSIITQIVSAVDIIVQLSRYQDGSRKISSISQIHKTNDDNIYEIKPVFKYVQKSFGNGVVAGDFMFCDYIPEFISSAYQNGFSVDIECFK